MATTRPIEPVTVPTTMRSAILDAIGSIAIVEAPVPVPGPDEVLVRLRAVGICGSDVHYFVDGRIGDAVVEYPFVLGHEPAGEVVQFGENVSGLAVGDRIALEPAHPCGVCHSCQIGRPNCCPKVRFLGTPPIPGVFEEYHLFAASQCIKIPDSVSFEAAATLEPMAVGIHAVDIGHVRPGDRVAIMGCGPVGILTAMAARAAGATFIAMTDPIAERRAHAEQLGADLVLDAQAGNVVNDINRQVGAIDIAFEAAGTQGAIDDATLVVRPAGTTVIIGIPSVDRISLWVHNIRRKELNIIMARRSNFSLEPAIRMMAAGLITPEKVVTHRFALDQLAEGMRFVHEYQDGVLKAMVVL